MKKYEEFINALQYVDQGDNKSAYDKLTELINDNLELENKTLYYDALYARASLDIANLNLHIDDSIEDLKILIANRTRYVKESYSLATLVYDHLEMPDEVIEYGTKALELNAPFTSEIAYALAKAYASRGTKSSYLEALKYIDTCIDNADEELNNVVDFLICKTDILISLNLTDQALSLIDEMMAKHGASETLYYLKSRAYYCKYDEDPVANKEYLDMAIDNLKICLQYDEKDLLAISLLVELYTIKKDKDRAFELIDKLDDGNHTEYIVLEKAKFYDEVGEYEEGRDLVLSFDKYQDNWKLVYTLGVFNKKLNNLEEARKYYKQALEMSHENFIASDIIDINIELNDELDSNAMLLKLAKENPEGVIFYQLAENSFRLGTPIKKVLNYYDKAHELGYLTDIEYIDVLSDYEKPDKTITKIIKKYDRKKTYPLLPVWCKKKMAVRYLYGENGIKQNIKKAIIKLFECRQEMPANTCVNAILGRGFELKKNFSLAHKMYDMAYQLIEQETKPSCDCAYSYYAHSLIEGVGVKQDVEEAKSIILKAIQKFKKFICSHTAYYYAYFALQGDEKFDISKAYELLSFDYPFVRFDISRIVYLTKLEEKLRIRSKKLNNLLADGKDVYDRKEWKYYRKAITEDCPKPYWRNI